ncbi:MAG: VWA domain-containing protein [Acidobacteriota bacterium]
MAEPEDLILDAAHAAARLAGATWRRHVAPSPLQVVRLADVRTRLELVVHALFRAPYAVSAAEPPAPVSWLARLARSRPAPGADARPGTDGNRIYLPPQIEDARQDGTALSVYLLLALEQAARLRRGTAPLALTLPREIRDRFLLAEAASVDRWIARTAPGLVTTLASERRRALRERGSRANGKARDGAVESLVRALLAAPPQDPPHPLMLDDGVGASLAWARGSAEATTADGPYVGSAAVWYWGHPLPASALPLSSEGGEDLAGDPSAKRRVAEMRRRPRVRAATEDEDDEGSGTWVIRADEPQESVEDPYGLQRPADRADAADPEGLGDSLSELPEARVVRTPGRPREVLRAGDEMLRRVPPGAELPKARGIPYPEWDYRVGQYREAGAIVREVAAPAADDRWAASALARHASLIRRVRARFERLRMRKTVLNRQPDGDELDIAACVSAAADLRAGGIVDDRLFLQLRPLRRELTVSLLVDVSASTDSWVSGNHRIVDVEKEALLVVCEALDALGDRYAIQAFSGEGPGHVSVVPLKRFGERAGPMVRQRIGSLDADGYTRLGAALRHATAALSRERARQRLLLVLSDGKPNDVDLYEGRYGTEDARMAVLEARRHGIDVFCLTVDREAPAYASRIFGAAGFALLRQPGHLPEVLIDVLRRLLRP